MLNSLILIGFDLAGVTDISQEKLFELKNFEIFVSATMLRNSLILRRKSYACLTPFILNKISSIIVYFIYHLYHMYIII